MNPKWTKNPFLLSHKILLPLQLHINTHLYSLYYPQPPHLSQFSLNFKNLPSNYYFSINNPKSFYQLYSQLKFLPNLTLMGCGLSAQQVNEPGIKWLSQLESLETQLKKSNDTHSMFGKWFWSYLFTKFKKYSMNTNEKLEFLSYLEKLLQFNFMSQSSQNLKSFDINDSGAKFHKLENHLYFKHKRAFNYFQFIANKKNHPELEKELLFTDLNFDMSQKEVLEVAAKVRYFCQDDLESFAFLSLYMQIAVTKGLETKSFDQQEKDYEAMLKILEKVYPANKAESQNALGMVGEIFKSITPGPDTFEQVKYDDEASHFDKLKQFILQKAEQAKKAKSQFEKLVKGICYEKGYGFKSGVKIKSAKNEESIFRTVQKLVESKVQKLFTQKQLNDKTYSREQIHDYIKQRKQIVFNKVKDLIEQQGSTKFQVKDLLRGKCTFDKIQDLVETGQKLISYIEEHGEHYQVIELKDKLLKKTKDLVTIIKFQNIVVELQLVLKLDSVSNEFNHKIYELLRSKLYSPIPNLFIHTEKWCHNFFAELYELYQNMMSYNKVLKNSEKIDFKFKDYDKDLIEFRSNFLLENGICQSRIGEGQGGEQVNEKIKELIKMISQSEGKVQTEKCSQVQRTMNEVKFLNKVYDFKKAKQIVSVISKSDLEKSSQILFVKAQVLRNMNISDQALENYNKCLAVRIKTLGQDSVQVAQVLLNIGIVYTKKGQYKQALDNYNKCLKIKVQISGPESIDVTETMENIAIIYQRNGDLKQALYYLNKSLQIKTKKFGMDSVDVASTFNYIGNAYSTKGQFDLALENYNKCLDIRKKVLGPDSVDVAQTLNNIGIVYGKKNDFKLALDNHKKCLDIRTKIMGPNSVDVAQSFNNIGVLYARQKDYKQALQNLKKCLQIRKKVMGAEHVDVSKTLQNIATIHRNQGDVKSALQTYKKCLQINTKIQPQSNDVVTTLSNIANAYWNLQDIGQAIEYYNRSLEIKIKISGENSAQVASIMSNIGNLYFKKGDFESALQVFNQCLEIRMSVLGEDSKDVKDVREIIELVTKSKVDLERALMKSNCCLEAPPPEEEAPETIDVTEIFTNLKNL